MTKPIDSISKLMEKEKVLRKKLRGPIEEFYTPIDDGENCSLLDYVSEGDDDV